MSAYTYNILSLLDSSYPAVGVSSDEGDSQPVVLGYTSTWEFTTVETSPRTIFQFGIQNAFTYSGEDSSENVIATTDASQNVYWHGTDRGLSDIPNQHAFTIEPRDDPGKAWTVSDASDPNSPIVIQDIVDTSNIPSTQLFTFIYLSNE